MRKYLLSLTAPSMAGDVALTVGAIKSSTTRNRPCFQGIQRCNFYAAIAASPISGVSERDPKNNGGGNDISLQFGVCATRLAVFAIELGVVPKNLAL